MTRWLVRFAYDGRRFHGWARQPGQETIEGTIRAGLVDRGLLVRGEPVRLEVASRTDRGVSARGNALALRSPLDGDALLRALNGISPSLYFGYARRIDDRFRVRGASYRWYRYFDPSDRPGPIGPWRDAARGFVGRLDARSFGRGLPATAPVWRDVTRLTVTEGDGGRVIDIVAPAFVWGMVRKIVAALRAIVAGTLSADEAAAAREGRRRLTLPLAEPEPLVLWEVGYPGAWEVGPATPTRAQQRYWAAERSAARLTARLVDALSAAEPPAGPVLSRSGR
ncbi:MAG TPA: hypothetical protein VMH78_08695 [Thermoplasmata archaeon]|nr:hypothetical protein [Thermoplasmata archaeon]